MTRAAEMPQRNALHIKIDPYSSLLFACCTKESILVWHFDEVKKELHKVADHRIHQNETKSSLSQMDFSNGHVLFTGTFRGKAKRKGKNGILSQVEPNIFVKAQIIRESASCPNQFAPINDDLFDLELPVAVQMWQQVGGICIVQSLNETDNLCFLASEPDGNIVLLDYSVQCSKEDSIALNSQSTKKAKRDPVIDIGRSKNITLEQVACQVLPPAHGFGKLKHLAAQSDGNSIACGMFDNAIIVWDFRQKQQLHCIPKSQICTPLSDFQAIELLPGFVFGEHTTLDKSEQENDIFISIGLDCSRCRGCKRESKEGLQGLESSAWISNISDLNINHRKSSNQFQPTLCSILRLDKVRGTVEILRNFTLYQPKGNSKVRQN
eukprot:767429-Hanusia_phi.AAC.7